MKRHFFLFIALAALLAPFAQAGQEASITSLLQHEQNQRDQLEKEHRFERMKTAALAYMNLYQEYVQKRDDAQDEIYNPAYRAIIQKRARSILETLEAMDAALDTNPFIQKEFEAFMYEARKRRFQAMHAHLAHIREIREQKAHRKAIKKVFGGSFNYGDHCIMQ